MQLLTPTTKEVSALIKTSKRESKQSSQIRDEIGKHDLLGASQSTQKLLPFALRIACRATASLWLFLRACERQTVTRINELVWTLLFKSISAKKKVMNDRSHCTDSNRKKKNNNLGWIFKKKITVLVFSQGAFYLQEVCNIYHLSLAIKWMNEKLDCCVSESVVSCLVFAAFTQLQAGQDLVLDGLDPGVPLFHTLCFKMPRLTSARHNEEVKVILVWDKKDNNTELRFFFFLMISGCRNLSSRLLTSLQDHSCA